MASTPSLASLLAAAQQFAKWSKTISPVVYELTNETVEAATRRGSELEAFWNGSSSEGDSDLKALKDELTIAHATRLEFGTAGLRGEMGPGIGRMNDVTVYQAAQGLVEHLVKTYGEAASGEKGIVIGYDHRARSFGKGDSPSNPAISSHRFALLTAIAALSRGMKVYLFNRLVCTPMVPYTVLATGALAGVMVTASHNPKKDDGYKVYGHNGAQIISPIDKYIATAIEANTEAWVPDAYASVKTDADLRAYAATLPAGAGHVIDRTDELVASYIADITSRLCRHPTENAASTVKIAYTAMHGVGTPFARAMFHAWNHPSFTETAEQCSPDPEFPTVVFPNPEEGKGALALAMKAAKAAGATLILANDPDADRLAVAEWVEEKGEWKVFSGNEIGALLSYWSWRCYQEAGGDPSNAVMTASTVSSKFIAAMAAKEGFTFQETLTGFKWMGNAMEAHKNAGRQVIFSFEEAIGFACGDVVRDKDGVSAAAVFAEMAAVLAREGRTAVQQLQWLYERYGYFITSNQYVFVDQPHKTNTIFARLRNEGHYWMRMGDLTIKSIRDLTSPGWDSAGDKPSLPTSSGTHMLTYKFSNGVTATLRTSGTEPKLKYYTEIQGADPVAAKAELDRTVTLILDEMLQPEKYGLKRPIRD